VSTLIIDNFDSFTWNLAQQAGAIEGVDPLVVPNDIAWHELLQLRPDRVILSPGPGHPHNPRDFGICHRVIAELHVPILGVCLGHQGICAAFGAEIVPADEPVHGRASRICHNGDALFEGVPSPFSAIRYHSLIAQNLPEVLQPIAFTEDGAGAIMAVRHRTRPLWGVQFHPESVLTEHGSAILRNFLRWQQPRLYSRRREFQTDAAADLFRALFAGQSNAFWLDSASKSASANRFSYMGSSEQVIEGTLFGRLASEMAARKVATDPSLPFPFQGGWVGYFGYEAKSELGSPTRHRASTPDARFVFADRFLALDHESEDLWLVSLAPDSETAVLWFDEMELAIAAIRCRNRSNQPAVAVESFHFAVDKQAYSAQIAQCLDKIRAGESYEICLTNRLHGTSSSGPLDYYETLRCRNPAPYAAFLQFPDFQIACSSPELFLSVSAGGHAVSKPMKGTAPRAARESGDTRLREQLRHDEKNRAENLMIVDLTRNDLGRVCQTGTVRVTNLMDIETFATVHQMVSTVEGHLRPGLSALHCLRSAFPPGSMTGAPKLRTMEIVDALETEARGVYSGCIGFLSLDGAALFNVVIRTAVFAAGEVTIGSGGAIVAQSVAGVEWNEMVLKTSALTRAFLPEDANAAQVNAAPAG
jgi:para-aminobenzoate synthetase